MGSPIIVVIATARLVMFILSGRFFYALKLTTQGKHYTGGVYGV
jgi:hypothetical protein